MSHLSHDLLQAASIPGEVFLFDANMRFVEACLDGGAQLVAVPQLLALLRLECDAAPLASREWKRSFAGVWANFLEFVVPDFIWTAQQISTIRRPTADLVDLYTSIV